MGRNIVTIAIKHTLFCFALSLVSSWLLQMSLALLSQFQSYENLSFWNWWHWSFALKKLVTFDQSTPLNKYLTITHVFPEFTLFSLLSLVTLLYRYFTIQWRYWLPQKFRNLNWIIPFTSLFFLVKLAAFQFTTSVVLAT